MNKTVSQLALTVSVSFAMVFTFSCSGDDGGGGSSSSSGGGSPSSSSVGTQGGVPDLPKQVYLTEWYCCDENGYDTVLKEPFNGNGDIFVHLYLDSERKGEYDSILAGKIQDGQLSLNLPASLDSKYLWDKVVPCEDYLPDGHTTCENNISGVPENLAFVDIDTYATISGRSDCYLNVYNPYLINLGETGRAEFYYFSESGRITGTETWTEPDGSSCRRENYDINFSKGWNLVSINYHDPNDCDNRDNYKALTTDLSKGTWEWWLGCGW